VPNHKGWPEINEVTEIWSVTTNPCNNIVIGLLVPALFKHIPNKAFLLFAGDALSATSHVSGLFVKYIIWPALKLTAAIPKIVSP